MRRAIASSIVLVLLAAAIAAPCAAAVAPERRTVVMVLAPYITWDDVRSGDMPFVRELASEAAMGSLNNRSIVAGGSRQSLEKAALSISAGNWIGEEPADGGLVAYSLDEAFETGRVSDAYTRLTGLKPGDAKIAYLGLPGMIKANEERTTEASMGTLGSAIVDAGGTTAAIGNSDTGFYASQPGLHRPAALVAMDRRGLVQLGDVSRRVLTVDDSRPFGLSTDSTKMEAEYDRVLAQIAQKRGPALVVVDPGETHRALAFAEEAAPTVAGDQWRAALRTVDAVAEYAHGNMPEGAVFMLVAPLAAGALEDRDPGGLAPLVVDGPGWRGTVLSPSTHRSGLSTGPDVNATVLEALGIRRPFGVIGEPMRTEPGGSFEQRALLLERMNATAIAHDMVRPAVVNTYIGLTLALFALCTLLLAKHLQRPVLVSAAMSALLLVLSVPLASYLMLAFWRWPATGGGAVLALSATSAGLWLGAMGVARYGRLGHAVAALSLATVAVLLVDQWAGGPLSFSTIFGYSPLLGARYFGMGNESAAMIVGGGLVGLGLLLDASRDAPWAKPVRSWGIPVVGLVVVATASAPFMGANVGVAVWGTVAFGLMWAYSTGHRLGWKTVALLLAVIVLLIGSYSALELLAPGVVGQTHLGRAWASAGGGGLRELWIIVARKAETNLRVLTRTNWSFILIAIIVFLGYMRWRPRGDFAETLTEYPDFAAALTASLIGGLVAYFTEDSGIVIPALGLLYVEVALLYLMLGNVRRHSSIEEEG